MNCCITRKRNLFSNRLNNLFLQNMIIVRKVWKLSLKEFVIFSNNDLKISVNDGWAIDSSKNELMCLFKEISKQNCVRNLSATWRRQRILIWYWGEGVYTKPENFSYSYKQGKTKFYKYRQKKDMLESSFHCVLHTCPKCFGNLQIIGYVEVLK